MLKTMKEQCIRNTKKTFTLIELIVVIVVIGILAAIVIPNISSFKEEASTTAMVADGRNIQTAVDMYQLKNNGKYPVENGNPIIGKPQEIDFNQLDIEYLRDFPQHDGMYYWIDYQGAVWFSTMDNPKDFERGETSLTWTPQEGAVTYTIYEVTEATSGASKNATVTKLDDVAGTTGSYTPNGYNKENTYLISVQDSYRFDAAPVIDPYLGSVPFQKDDFMSSQPVPTGSVEIKRDWIAAGEEKDVAKFNGIQSNPQITPDGKFAIWQDLRNGNNDIYRKNLETNEEFIVSNATVHQEHPQITPDGQLAIWQEVRNTNYDVYGRYLDSLTSQDFVIVSKAGYQDSPQITPDKKIVVWSDKRSGNYDIYGMDLDTNVEFPIVIASGNQQNPQISADGKIVVWTDYRNGGISDIYGKNLITNEEFPITTAKNFQMHPQITPDGKMVVWADGRSGNYDIYGKNLITNEELPITIFTQSQQNPQITPDGKIVVWQDNRNGNWDIYGKNLENNKEFLISDAINHQESPQITDDGKLVIYTTTQYSTAYDIVIKEISNLIN